MGSCRHISFVLQALVLSVLASCGHRDADTGSRDVDVLVSVNDSSLTLGDVLRRIPAGLAPEDSAEMFHRTVDRWVERMVLREVAEKNIPDMAGIDEMTERYRDNLIVDRYLSMMEERGVKEISDSRIKEYYEAHREMMSLQEPLVKGIFIKVASGSDDLPKLRRWLAAATDDAVDNIEKYGLRQASQYEYFKDVWMPWHSVAELIPYRFYDADAFVSSTRDFETEYAGSVYLLKLIDFLPSGSPTPYEYARGEIRDILRADDMSRYRDRLVGTIYGEAIDDGILRAGLYDPVKRTMKVDNKNNIKK